LTLLTGSTDTPLAHAVRPGRTYCFELRATDLLGHAGEFEKRCMSLPVDDWSLDRDAGGGRGTPGPGQGAGSCKAATGARQRSGKATNAEQPLGRSLIGYLFHCLMTVAWRGSV